MNRCYGMRADELIQKVKTQGAELADFVNLPFEDIRFANLIRDVFRSCNLEPNFAITLNYPQYATPCLYKRQPCLFKNVAASIVTTTTYVPYSA